MSRASVEYRPSNVWGDEETRVSAFNMLNRGPEGRLGDLRRQISEGRRRHVEESATSARPERTEGRRDERTQRRQSPARFEKTKVSDRGVTKLAREIAEENALGSGNGTGGITSTPDAVQALFGMGVTTEQLQAAVAALSALGGNVPGTRAGKALLGPHTEHAATSEHKGKKTRRSGRRPGKGLVIEEVLVEDVPEGEDDESSECRVSAFKRLGGEETRVSAFDRLNRGPEGRPCDLRRQISEGRWRHVEESATSDACSARPERIEGRRDEWTQRHQSPTRTKKTKVSDWGVTELAREIAEFKSRVETRPPYSNLILRTIKAYSGTTDPQDHLSKFYASMEAAAAPDEVKCRCFLATLEGSACDWFNRLLKGTIDNWDTLAEKFLTHFAANRRQRLPYSHLLNICIRKGEKELRKNPPPTYQETLARANFLASEEFDDAPNSEAAPAKRAPVDLGEIAKIRNKKKDYIAGPRMPSAGVYSVGVPVGMGRELALSPLPHVETYAVSGGSKYCEYHRNNTHNTKECFTLQKEMHRLIARGPAPREDGAAPLRGAPEGRTWRKPAEPVVVATQARNPEKTHIGRDCDDLDEDEAQGYLVGFIHGGNIGGDSVAQRKRWKHMAFVAKVHQAPAPKLGRREQIQFTEKDLLNTPSTHRDALVVKIEINDAIVHRTLVDTGSSVNIMYEKTFQNLGLNRKDLRPVRTPLSGFTGDYIEAERVITVPVIVGDGAHKAKLKMEFMVVSINCAHNMILGWPGLEDLEYVISPYYLCMKFPTPSGIGVARGDQKLARSCYVRITKKLPRDETLVVNAQEEMRKLEARPKAELAKEVEDVPLDPRAPRVEGEDRGELDWEPAEALSGRAHRLPRDLRMGIRGYAGGGSQDHMPPTFIAPEGFRAYYSIRFGFKASNNEAEYEALLCGLRLAAGMNTTKLRVKCDSKLVVGHVSGEFEAKDERMKKYRVTALELLKSFTAYSVELILRAENAEADILSKLSSETPEHVRRMANVEELSEPSIHAFLVVPPASRSETGHGGGACRDLLCPPRGIRGVEIDNPRRIFLDNNHEGLRGVREKVQGLPRVPEVDGLKRKFEACGGEWAEQLPYIPWTYRTTPRRATGETPFVLCYGFEARAPAEISIATHREEIFDPERNEEALAAELHLVHKRREAAFIRAENYQRKVKSYHDWRVRARGFFKETGCCARGRHRAEGTCPGHGMMRIWSSFISRALLYPNPKREPVNPLIELNKMKFLRTKSALTIPGCFPRMKVKHSRSVLLHRRKGERRPYSDVFLGWRSNTRARRSSTGGRSSADHTRMFSMDEGQTLALGAPPQEEGRAQTIPGCFPRMKVKHSRSALLHRRKGKRRPFPDVFPG
ncbi:unnamed protein product [Cuscuta campestris]|uniref:RNase H type-1 domain-containing protein n=1 Tax=Cuscuta campestris TaxID=132261 RepID=A0A484NBK8_9ASTE|nr:unnamed protein product [Cuscuta campestris]